MKRPGIYGFQGQWRFLSNFYIEPDGTHVEGEFQSAKCVDAQDRKRFRKSQPVSLSWELSPFLDPARCKAIGKTVRLRNDWEDIKVEIMTFHVAKKFRDHPELAEKLKLTLSFYLEETNMHGDEFWGVCNGKGLNMLGEILMLVRMEL